MISLRVVLLAACVGPLAACGSDDATSDPPIVPTDLSVQGLAAFLEQERYQQTGWTPESAAPRPQENGSPHSTVRVWLNDVAVAGQAKDPENLPVDSMAVKELFEGDTLVGVASVLKTTEGEAPNTWLYYCYGPAGRCSTNDPEATKEDPIYGRGLDVSCGFCHAAIITSLNPH